MSNFLVPVVQYMRPDGRRVEQSVAVDEQTYQKCAWILITGARFEAEVLMTGEVSLTIANEDGCDMEIEVVPNESNRVLNGFQDMVDRYYQRAMG